MRREEIVSDSLVSMMVMEEVKSAEMVRRIVVSRGRDGDSSPKRVETACRVGDGFGVGNVDQECVAH